MRARKVVKFAGIHHVGKKFSLSFFEGLVNEPNGFEIRDVNVGSPVKYEQRTFQAINVGIGEALA